MRHLVAALSLVLMSLLLVTAPASALDPPSEIQVTLSDYANAQHLELNLVVGLVTSVEFAQTNSDMNGAGVIRSKLLEVLPFEPGSTRASTHGSRLTRRLPQ